MQRWRRAKKRICGSQLRQSPLYSCTNRIGVPLPVSSVVELHAVGCRRVRHVSSPPVRTTARYRGFICLQSQIGPTLAIIRMSTSLSIFHTRHDQMFPVFDAPDVAKLRRFGQRRSYADGEPLAETGKASPGMLVDPFRRRRNRAARCGGATHDSSSLDGPRRRRRRSLSALCAAGPARRCHRGPTGRGGGRSPDRMHDLLVEESRARRAHHARCSSCVALRLLETGAGGPVIVGRADQADGAAPAELPVAQRSSLSDPRSRSRQRRAGADRALPGRPAGPADRARPNGAAAAQSDRHRPGTLHRPGPFHRSRTSSTTWPSSAPDRPASPTAVYAGSEGLSTIVLDSRAFGGQAGASAQDRELLRLSDRHLGPGAHGARLQPGAEVRGRYGDSRRGRRPAPRPGDRFRIGLGQRRAGPCPCRRGRHRGALSPAGAWPISPTSREASIHYWASPLEAKLCGGQEVALVGAGNSAGQAAIYLASRVAKVWLLVRGRGLEDDDVETISSIASPRSPTSRC